MVFARQQSKSSLVSQKRTSFDVNLPQSHFILYLESLALVNFRNYEQVRLACSARLNCFVGRNGMGKTNLLEAIYYLCMGKSHTNLNDQYLARHDADFFRLEGVFLANGEAREQIVVKMKARQRKEIARNGAPYPRLADHVGRYPVVIITPDDTLIATEGSEERRRLLDNTLCQIDNRYLTQLLQYNQLLKQRNALLKQWEGRPVPAGLLEVYDLQMESPAQYIYERRQLFIADFGPRLAEAYSAISGGQEAAALEYRSALRQAGWAELMARQAEQDRALQRTTAGIHRDDLLFSLSGHPLKRMASQGQLKSYVLSLKLAQYQIIREQKGAAPILLLDDIFDKLDRGRVEQLLAYLLASAYGQIFISDTDPERVNRLLQPFGADKALYLIDQGTAEPYDQTTDQQTANNSL